MQNAECRIRNAVPRNTQHATRFALHARRSTLPASRSSSRGFTMIEIALSLAIIGFALIAIIGVLPIGMNTQAANRETTIINQDATIWMNAIRNGARGLDDLTNYVIAITNDVTQYDPTMRNVVARRKYGYTPTSSSTTPPYPLINGQRIVGLLSTPKYIALPPPPRGGRGDVLSNNVVAYVRAMSGAASEKYPQDNQAVQDLAFSYRMTSEVVPYGTNYYDPSWVDYTQPGLSANDVVARSNYWQVVRNLQANLHDVRLLFRWPLRSRAQLGLGGQGFRTLVGGQLSEITTNENGQALSFSVFFFDPRTYMTNAP
jgi:type II secretory pathway pseudopilin PulG